MSLCVCRVRVKQRSVEPVYCPVPPCPWSHSNEDQRLISHYMLHAPSLDHTVISTILMILSRKASLRRKATLIVIFFLSLNLKIPSTSPSSQAGLSLPLRTPPAGEKFIKFYDLPKSVLLISLTKATNLVNHHVCH